MIYPDVFPFCVQTEPVPDPNNCSIELSLEKAMNLYWLAQKAKLEIDFDVQGYVTGEEGGIDYEAGYVELGGSITKSFDIYDGSSIEDRVCNNDKGPDIEMVFAGSETLSNGSYQNQLSYYIKLFAIQEEPPDWANPVNWSKLHQISVLNSTGLAVSLFIEIRLGPGDAYVPMLIVNDINLYTPSAKKEFEILLFGRSYTVDVVGLVQGFFGGDDPGYPVIGPGNPGLYYINFIANKFKLTIT